MDNSAGQQVPVSPADIGQAQQLVTDVAQSAPTQSATDKLSVPAPGSGQNSDVGANQISGQQEVVSNEVQNVGEGSVAGVVVEENNNGSNTVGEIVNKVDKPVINPEVQQIAQVSQEVQVPQLIVPDTQVAQTNPVTVPVEPVQPQVDANISQVAQTNIQSVPDKTIVHEGVIKDTPAVGSLLESGLVTPEGKTGVFIEQLKANVSQPTAQPVLEVSTAPVNDLSPLVIPDSPTTVVQQDANNVQSPVTVAPPAMESNQDISHSINTPRENPEPNVALQSIPASNNISPAVVTPPNATQTQVGTGGDANIPGAGVEILQKASGVPISMPAPGINPITLAPNASGEEGVQQGGHAFTMAQNHPLKDLYTTLSQSQTQGDMLIQQEMEAEKRHSTIDMMQQEAYGWQILSTAGIVMMIFGWLAGIVFFFLPMFLSGQNDEKKGLIVTIYFIGTFMVLLASSILSIWVKVKSIFKWINWGVCVVYVTLFILVALRAIGTIKDIPLVNSFLNQIAF